MLVLGTYLYAHHQIAPLQWCRSARSGYELIRNRELQMQNYENFVYDIIY